MQSCHNFPTRVGMCATIRNMVREPKKIYRDEFAAMLGLKSARSLARRKLPPRDGTDIEGGRARPYWYLATVRRYIANLPGRGYRSDLHGERDA